MSTPILLDAPSQIHRHAIPADMTYVEPLRKRFSQALSSCGLDDKDLIVWQLVFSEMVYNAIIHGADCDPSKKVHIEWCATQESVILAAEDPGPGPPDDALLAPKLPDDPTCETSRGLFIITSFADEIHTWRGPRGFRMEVVKSYPTLGLALPDTPEIDSVFDELTSCYEGLSISKKLTEFLVGSESLRDFIDKSLEEFDTLHPFDRIFIFGGELIPESIRENLMGATWYLDFNDADPVLAALGKVDRETVWETYEDIRRQKLPFTDLHTVGAGCVFPIIAGEIHLGALMVLRKATAPDMKFRSQVTLRTLADLCGIAALNTHLSIIRKKAEKDVRELEIATEIQKALLPILPCPQSPHWNVSIHQKSSMTVAGDYAMAKTDSDGNLIVAMIDVMGKGVSAALLASIFRTALDMSVQISSAATILETINRTLCKQLGNLSMFITCAIARVTVDGRHLDHASAGHCPTFFYLTDGSKRFFQPSGPPLGILPDVSYVSDITPLQGGERLVFVTDGCYEWDRTDQEQGWQNFVEQVDLVRTAPPEALWRQVYDRIRLQNDGNLEDDCTLITLDILP